MKSGGAPRRLEGLAFVAPFLLLYGVVLIWPLLMGIGISFHRADLFGAREWIGLGNYATALADPVVHQAIGNTLLLALLIVPPLTALALLLALALNRATRGAAVFRGIFFSSSVLSVTIVTLIWRFILTPDAGLLAVAADALGREPLPFLSDQALVIPAIAITTIWWSLGFPIMLFLAGLQQVPADVYEAAALDRAGRWTTFRHITLPAIRRTLLLVVMLQTVGQLQLFGQAQLLTGGGPGGGSRTIVLAIFEVAFGRWELGYATALAEILFAMILVVTLLQYWLVTRREDAG
ncbi:multiple sugar transport system permease protein [Polymorphobacter multimanifer]|uniref:Multiple sugar transport system permease protein n=1 Tax=Polymorphobacter multimanifer TaxID=1070431 RepID=A0A841L563_9SPHN|nr:sugar ABC transporter permease [Polymorphobacter multimanifer]MBB6227767.1 multiple sugar transport system permease protein [Polymorphobacter multimanifer]